MKKLTPLFILMILVFSGCSTESLEDQGQISNFDAKVSKQATTLETNEFTYPMEDVCVGEDATFTFNVEIGTNVQLQENISNTDEDDWVQVIQESQTETNPQSYTMSWDEPGTHYFRYKAGKGGFTEIQPINVVKCATCDETFSYDDTGDGDATTYTFYYTPKEDMTAADLVFTFAQSVAISGFPENEGWVNNGNATSSTNETTMDLEACHTYEWTLTLEKDCSGHSGNSNLWTDFKVNDVSKKNFSEPTPNITQSCD